MSLETAGHVVAWAMTVLSIVAMVTGAVVGAEIADRRGRALLARYRTR